MSFLLVVVEKWTLLDLRVPVYKITAQAQTGICAFFRVKLHCKNIISRDGTGKGSAVQA